jgi:phenylalanyl-tRNA synthetase beta chain
MLALAVTGNDRRQRWNAPESATGFYHIKGYMELVLSRFGFRLDEIIKNDRAYGWYKEALSYSTGGFDIAAMGTISKKYLAMFDIKQDVFYAEIYWENILKALKSHQIRFSELPRYPWVRRDLALLIDKTVKFSQIHDLAFKTERNILREVDLFDVYESDALGPDKKSYAVSFILRDDRQTLTEKNIEKVMSSLTKAFEREFGAMLR